MDGKDLNHSVSQGKSVSTEKWYLSNDLKKVSSEEKFVGGGNSQCEWPEVKHVHCALKTRSLSVAREQRESEVAREAMGKEQRCWSQLGVNSREVRGKSETAYRQLYPRVLLERGTKNRSWAQRKSKANMYFYYFLLPSVLFCFWYKKNSTMLSLRGNAFPLWKRVEKERMQRPMEAPGKHMVKAWTTNPLWC